MDPHPSAADGIPVPGGHFAEQLEGREAILQDCDMANICKYDMTILNHFTIKKILVHVRNLCRLGWWITIRKSKVPDGEPINIHRRRSFENALTIHLIE